MKLWLFSVKVRIIIERVVEKIIVVFKIRFFWRLFFGYVVFGRLILLINKNFDNINVMIKEEFYYDLFLFFKVY